MKKRKYSLIILFTLGLIIFISYVIVVQANKEVRIYADPYKEQIEFYNTEVSSNSLSVEEKEKLTLKMQPFLEMATQHAYAQELHIQGTRPTIEKTVYPVTMLKLPDGIDNFPVIPMFTSDVILTNAWRKTAGGITYLVYAGTLKNDRTQSLVLIKKPGTIDFLRILSPKKIGEVRIQDFKDFTIILTSEKGEILFFDVLNQKFIGSVDEALKSGDVIPTITPVPYPVP